MRTNQESLEKFYIQSLDNDIIEYLEETKKIVTNLCFNISLTLENCKTPGGP